MTMTDEPVEELLELCWTAMEDGLSPLNRDHLPLQLICFLPPPLDQHPAPPGPVIDGMLRDGWLTAEGRRIQLSPAGQHRAKEVVRRHRLTEVLLHTLLTISEAAMESTACQVEHILNTEVTEAVCAFLGHPPSCPHGRAIPRGHCCEQATATVEPLIVPLARLPAGVGREGAGPGPAAPPAAVAAGARRAGRGNGICAGRPCRARDSG